MRKRKLPVKGKEILIAETKISYSRKGSVETWIRVYCLNASKSQKKASKRLLYQRLNIGRVIVLDITTTTMNLI